MRTQAHGKVYGPNGEERPIDPVPPATWHPSFSYFRRSQVTDDLFDAYRSLYLALEALLSDLEPPRSDRSQRWEHDKTWFLRALRKTGASLDLGSYSSSAGVGDAASSIYRELYEQVRISIFHAKLPRRPYVPSDLLQRQVVSDRLYQLRRLYLDLAREHLGVSFGGRRLAAGTARAMVDATLGAMDVYLTARSSDLDSLAVQTGTTGTELHAMELEAIRYEEGGLATALWCSGASDVGVIRSVVGVMPERGVVGLTSILPAELTVEGFDRVEFQVVDVVRGSGEARLEYAT